jgi:predicted metal-binding membrane protein
MDSALLCHGPPSSRGRRGDAGFLIAAAAVFLGAVALTLRWCRSDCCSVTPMPGDWDLSATWMRAPGQTWLGAGAWFMAMWAVMMVAMMVPCLAPMLLIYRRALGAVGCARREWLTAVAGAGYFMVWIAFGAAVYPPGVMVAAMLERWAPLARSVPVVSALVLVLAGAAQFTRWKSCQVRCCREANLGAGSVRPEARGALRHGVRLGWRCWRCCSAPMAVLLAIGVMDLAAMGVVTIVMAAERLMPRPEWVARLGGAAAMAGGAWELARAVRGG